ncbi:MAG: 2-amino-4-hydroxy-6-hydroxymethyldihydropteridine diphosphokinase [Candidatus Methylacidiphilales bacterium]|nr:2-amino-4-hydroxy-6-hydroxymethyldihydropteridine diphosphokinase [Candidatus Methylacidiphilales bacterium]
MKVGVGIGSNLGDRGAEITAAFDFLRVLDPAVRRSRIYESEPLDCPPGSGKFLNAAAVISWSGDLLDLLDRFHAHERERGRAVVRPVNAPRPVDLDLLFAEDYICNTARLVLPHPRMRERDFVLRPLAELEPDFPLPPDGSNVQDLLTRWLHQHGESPCQPID